MRSLKVYNHSDFINVSRIKKGTFNSYINKAIKKDDNSTYVIKKMLYTDEKSINSCDNEIKINRLLKHPNIIGFYGIYTKKEYKYLVMEYAELGNLKTINIQNKTISERCDYIFQILNAVKHCHEQGVIHRDLKLENILLTNNNQIKLCDFGLSVFVDENNDLEEHYGIFFDSVKRKLILKHKLLTWKSKKVLGTRLYMPPEMFLEEEYTYRIDLWSIGVIIFYLLLDYRPFNNKKDQEYQNKIITCSYELPENIDVNVKSFIEAFLQVDPLKRIGIDDALVHPLLFNHILERL